MKFISSIIVTLIVVPIALAQKPAPSQVKSFGRKLAQQEPSNRPPTEKSTEKNSDKPDIALAEPEDINNENFPDLIDSFDYPNAEITDVVKAISELTKKNFIIDQNVRGKISIIAPTQITVAEAYKAFLTALSVNGYTVVPSGKFLKITLARNATKDSIETYSGSYSPDSDIMITRIVQLKYISADEVVNKVLRSLATKDGIMFAYAATNSIIISDFGSNIERLVKIIGKLDVPGFEERMEVIRIRYAKAKIISDLIDQILDKEGKRKQGGRAGTTFSSSVPRFGEAKADSSENFRVISDDRTNSLIVLGNDTGIARIRKLVQRLDYRLKPEDAGGVYVYYVKYGDAEGIANTLSGIASKSKSGAGGTPGAGSPISPFNPVPLNEGLFGGDVKITAEKSTNSLIVTAGKPDYEIVKSLLRKIDIAKDQVYVEAIIMEMQADKVNTYSANVVKFLNPDDGGKSRVGYVTGDFGALLNPTSKGTILGFGNGETIDISVGGVATKVKSLIGLISFLKTTTDANILSTPQIMALNNEKAMIEVGSDVPTGKASQVGTGGVTNNSTERTKATIKLQIEPFIAPNSSKIRMKVNQSIKGISQVPVAAAELAASAVSIDERTIETMIVVPDGNTAVLGGLMKNDESITVDKVPVLGDIPVLGWLFKSIRKIVRKTNLVVFLTPKIMRAEEDSQELFNRKIRQRSEFVREQQGGRDTFGKEFEDALNFGKDRRATIKATPKEQDEIIDETLNGEEVVQ
ncbi:MAG: type II secretion system secretin GspD [Pseudomonadota bacterium]|nr:type II secretion system secretin GspD [Pseudomonadota bacterium]